jgi:hypothetical protein
VCSSFRMSEQCALLYLRTRFEINLGQPLTSAIPFSRQQRQSRDMLFQTRGVNKGFVAKLLPDTGGVITGL